MGRETKATATPGRAAKPERRKNRRHTDTGENAHPAGETAHESMTGLYLHIPFCQRRCIYCDFYSTTCGAEERGRYVDALCRELAARAAEAGRQQLATIYLGGGTPSQLSPGELEWVLRAVYDAFEVSPEAEVTVEANPDDLTADYVAALAGLPVNRVSLGVQTFDDDALRLLRRRHTGRQATEAVERLAGAGFENLSLDLIYGLPGQTLPRWEADLDRALSLPATHLSAYALIYEEDTELWRMRRRGEVAEADEELSLSLFERLMDKTAEAGFAHYEISNFARPGWQARHNTAYWTGEAYIGCGPGAHSYDGCSIRRRNLPDLTAYTAASPDVPCETEQLGTDERYNEFILTSLRMADGLDLAALAERFGTEARAETLRTARGHLSAGRLRQDGERLRLTRRGLFVSDDVMSDFMRVAS